MRQNAFSPGTTLQTTPSLRPEDTNQNPVGIGLWSLLREDLRTYNGKLFEQGFWAVAVHRFGNWRMGIRPKLLRAPFSIFYRFLYKCVEWTCGISLPYSTKLGRRVRLWHHGGMILHAAAIGDDCQIRQNTTFGVVHVSENVAALPTIEERVHVGCGVAILGPIRIGHDSVIGANAVVLKDVPAGSVAVGVPARLIQRAVVGTGT